MEVMENSNIREAFSKLYTKLDGWLDSLILNLPNFILAILVFIVSIIIAKYVGKLLRQILRKSLAQASIINISIKVTKSIVVLIGFFIALGCSTWTRY